ncbi:unnamed protein product, partial [Phytomonas sp. Hart1]
MDNSDSGLMILCNVCGTITRTNLNPRINSDRVIDFAFRCENCNSSLVHIFGETVPFVFPLSLSNLSVQNLVLTRTTQDRGNLSSELPEGCQDFTTDEILHVLNTFKYGLPPEEVQYILSNSVKNTNNDSVDPGCPIEGMHSNSNIENITTAVVEGLENPSSRISYNNYGGNAANSHRSYENVTAATLPCPICFEDIIGSSVCIVKLFCSHYYHQACLREWLMVQKYTCPICRKPLIME